MSNVFRTELSGLIKKNKTTSKINNMVREISRYIDKNHSILFDSGLTFRLYFTDNDKALLYKTLNIPMRDVENIIKKSDDVNPAWKITTNPFIILSATLVRELMIEGDEKNMAPVLIYLTLLFYSSTHSKYFRFEPNAEIMRYTINNLSNKYLIKKMGTLFKALEHTAMTSHETYKESLKKGTDQDIVDYINALSTRVDGMVKNLAKEFYDNHDNKRYMNLDSDSYDEDNFHIADNNSFAAEGASNAVYLKFVSKGVNFALVDLAANSNNVSVNELRNTLVKLTQDKNSSKDVKRLIQLIIELFILEGKNKPSEIRSKKFLYDSLMIYKKSNTNDKSILAIREILDKILKDGCETYKKTNRAATQNDFKRALFMFFILTIQDNS